MPLDFNKYVKESSGAVSERNALTLALYCASMSCKNSGKTRATKLLLGNKYTYVTLILPMSETICILLMWEHEMDPKYQDGLNQKENWINSLKKKMEDVYVLPMDKLYKLEYDLIFQLKH